MSGERDMQATSATDRGIRGGSVTEHNTCHIEEGRQCPECGSYSSSVTETKFKKEYRQHLRKRVCSDCGTVWATKEVTVKIIKSKHRKEARI